MTALEACDCSRAFIAGTLAGGALLILLSSLLRAMARYLGGGTHGR